MQGTVLIQCKFDKFLRLGLFLKQQILETLGVMMLVLYEEVQVRLAAGVCQALKLSHRLRAHTWWQHAKLALGARQLWVLPLYDGEHGCKPAFVLVHVGSIFNCARQVGFDVHIPQVLVLEFVHRLSYVLTIRGDRGSAVLERKDALRALLLLLFLHRDESVDGLVHYHLQFSLWAHVAASQVRFLNELIEQFLVLHHYIHHEVILVI